MRAAMPWLSGKTSSTTMAFLRGRERPPVRREVARHHDGRGARRHYDGGWGSLW